MGSSLRSVFGRKPLAIPPPVVCWVYPGGIVPIFPILHVKHIDQWEAYGEGYKIATEVEIYYEYQPARPSRVVRYLGRFVNPGVLPNEPDAETGLVPIPHPELPVNNVPWRFNLPRRLVFLTKRWDDTVWVRMQVPGTVLANKYIDLKRIQKKG